VDLLTDARLADSIDGAICSLGYKCLHRSADAANYVRGDERVDFLFASRPVAMELLSGAVSHQTPFGELRVVSLEGLIAFKLQGLVNDPRRSRDLEDIRALLEANRGTVDLSLVRRYFRLFDKEELLDELLAETR
jgi:predicted nucleotidyltransferase component of viral defense system